MSISLNRISQYLVDFGLSSEEAQAYLYLFKHGMSSAVEVSKDLKLSRPKVYRVMDKLIKKDLVVAENAGGARFVAASYKHLEMLLAQREQEVARLKQVKPELFEELEKLARRYGDDAQVRLYQGFEGLDEVYAQSLDQDEVVVLGGSEWLVQKDKGLWGKLQKGWTEKQTRVSMLSNAREWDEKQFEGEFLDQCWSAWFVDPGEFLITSEVLIYADTVVLCEERRTGIECVEFRNRALALLVKRLYEFVWFRAEEVGS